jgi:dihydropteroate synthase
MGVLNLTPDSFSDGGLFLTPATALPRALEIQAQGADILDLGAQSTRPGHIPVPPEEELARLLPVLEALRGKLRIPISVDTYYPAVAAAALTRGAVIINDVCGKVNAEMAALVKQYGAGWILMHNAEIPASQDALAAVRAGLQTLLEEALAFGLAREQLCLDPGVGFGKTMEGNLQLLSGVSALCSSGAALLVGASRKRVIDYAAGGGTPPGQRLGGSIAAHVAAALGGADILRVHDVAETVQAIRVARRLRALQASKELTNTSETCKMEKMKTGLLRVRGLELFAYHGCNPEEQLHGQLYLLDLDLRGDYTEAMRSDSLTDTVNYAAVIKCCARTFAEGTPCDLIERAARRTAEAVLREFSALKSVRLCVHKPDAPIQSTVSDISFTLELQREGMGHE